MYPTLTLVTPSGSPLCPEQNFSIMIDGHQVVCDIPDLTSGLECVLSCYFLFGLEFCTKAKHTLMWLETYVTKLECKRPSGAVLRVAALLD